MLEVRFGPCRTKTLRTEHKRQLVRWWRNRNLLRTTDVSHVVGTDTCVCCWSVNQDITCDMTHTMTLIARTFNSSRLVVYNNVLNIYWHNSQVLFYATSLHCSCVLRYRERHMYSACAQMTHISALMDNYVKLTVEQTHKWYHFTLSFGIHRVYNKLRDVTCALPKWGHSRTEENLLFALYAGLRKTQKSFYCRSFVDYCFQSVKLKVIQVYKVRLYKYFRFTFTNSRWV